jgi:hypothetical protein
VLRSCRAHRLDTRANEWATLRGGIVAAVSEAMQSCPARFEARQVFSGSKEHEGHDKTKERHVLVSSQP